MQNVTLTIWSLHFSWPTLSTRSGGTLPPQTLASAHSTSHSLTHRLPPVQFLTKLLHGERLSSWFSNSPSVEEVRIRIHFSVFKIRDACVNSVDQSTSEHFAANL